MQNNLASVCLCGRTRSPVCPANDMEQRDKFWRTGAVERYNEESKKRIIELQSRRRCHRNPLKSYSTRCISPLAG